MPAMLSAGDEGRSARSPTHEFIQIRADDLELIADLWESMRVYYATIAPGKPIYGQEESWAQRARSYRRLLLDPDGMILGLVVDGSFVAYAATRSAESSAVFAWSHRTAEVETLVVAASARGQGFGRMLLARLRTELRKRGIDELVLHVLSTNQAALEFYRREGFSPYLVLLSDAIPTGGSQTSGGC